MESPVRRSGGRGPLGFIAVTLLGVLVIGGLASPAYSQVPDLPIPPDLPDVPLPDPPGDLPVPDPDDLPLPDTSDLPVPDPDELPLPNPDELPVPDPDKLPVPDPDPDGNPRDDLGRDRDRPGAGGHRVDGAGKGSSRNNGFARTALGTVAVTRGGSSLVQAGRDARAAGSEERNGLGESLAAFAFPLILVVAVAAFLALQGYFDRRDPKLALGPVDARDGLLTFD